MLGLRYSVLIIVKKTSGSYFSGFFTTFFINNCTTWYSYKFFLVRNIPNLFPLYFKQYMIKYALLCITTVKHVWKLMFRVYETHTRNWRGGLKKNRIIFQLSCLIVLFCGVLVFNDKNPPVLKIHKRSWFQLYVNVSTLYFIVRIFAKCSLYSWIISELVFRLCLIKQ